jgi:hypothetical protein
MFSYPVFPSIRPLTLPNRLADLPGRRRSGGQLAPDVLQVRPPLDSGSRSVRTLLASGASLRPGGENVNP